MKPSRPLLLLSLAFATGTGLVLMALQSRSSRAISQDIEEAAQHPNEESAWPQQGVLAHPTKALPNPSPRRESGSTAVYSDAQYATLVAQNQELVRKNGELTRELARLQELVDLCCPSSKDKAFAVALQLPDAAYLTKEELQWLKGMLDYVPVQLTAGEARWLVENIKRAPRTSTELEEAIDFLGLDRVRRDLDNKALSRLRDLLGVDHPLFANGDK